MGRLDGSSLRHLRHRVWLQLDVRETREHGPSAANWTVSILIVIAVALAVIGTEPQVVRWWGRELLWAELTLGAVFLCEYLLRVWCMGERVEFAGWRGRLRYMRQPTAVLDLLALLPFLVLFGTNDFFVLRIVRLLRILALGRLGEFSAAFRRILLAIGRRAGDLMIAMMCAGFVILIAATALYLVEREVQPEAFGSIPRAIWWAVATVTTVGYGDVHPVTALGKVFGSITALAGIAVIAMPAGIMAAAFSDALGEHRAARHGRSDPSHEPPGGD